MGGGGGKGKWWGGLTLRAGRAGFYSEKDGKRLRRGSSQSLMLCKFYCSNNMRAVRPKPMKCSSAVL